MESRAKTQRRKGGREVGYQKSRESRAKAQRRKGGREVGYQRLLARRVIPFFIKSVLKLMSSPNFL
jgi:hypothetical protein